MSFFADRGKLMSKKPFARARGISDDNFGKDRGAVFQSSVMETGLIQVVCLGASLLIGAGCVWIFYNASTEMDGTSFLSLLLQPQQKAFALFFACLAGTLMAFSGRRHKGVFIVLGLLLAGGIASLPYVYPVKVNPSLLGGSGSGQAPEDEAPQDNAGSMVLPPDTIQKASVQNYGEGDLRPLFSAIARKQDQGVLGLWVVGVNAANRDMVKSYLKRMTQSGDDRCFTIGRVREAVCSSSHPRRLRSRSL